MAGKKIEFLANLKSVRVWTLVSGDKQVNIELIVVGAGISEAIKLGDLPVDRQVKVVGNWELEE